MTWDEYKQWVSARCTMPHTQTVEGCKLALEGETHEFNAAKSTLAAIGIDFQKREMDGRTLDPKRLHDACTELFLEASDVLFYVARLHTLEGQEALELPELLKEFMGQSKIDLETLIRVNVEKLTARDEAQQPSVLVCPSCGSVARKLFLGANDVRCESCR